MCKRRSVVSGAPSFAIYYETRVTSYREKALNFDVSKPIVTVK